MRRPSTKLSTFFFKICMGLRESYIKWYIYEQKSIFFLWLTTSGVSALMDHPIGIGSSSSSFSKTLSVSNSISWSGPFIAPLFLYSSVTAYRNKKKDNSVAL